MKNIPTYEATQDLEEIRQLALNSKGNPRSLRLIRKIDLTIQNYKRREREGKFKQLIEFLHAKV